jgi:hypothetical protein
VPSARCGTLLGDGATPSLDQRQRALYRRRIERIAELLTAALGVSIADTVLVAGYQIEACHPIVRPIELARRVRQYSFAEYRQRNGVRFVQAS